MQAQSREPAALASAFLAYFTPQQEPRPFLAAELPSPERGTWTVAPDGRMQTIYTLRDKATWHDGQPITAADFAFAHRVRVDPAFPGFGVDLEHRIASALASDPKTLVIDWKEPYLWAGMVALPDFSPMPRHVLEPLYQEGMDAFVNGPQWRERFIGSGPFSVERWEPGVELILRAHDGFALGRPPLDEVHVRFIADPNAAMASLLAGAVHMVPGHFGYEMGQAIERAGWAGTVDYWTGNPRPIVFQARDWGNIQRAVLDVRVRRAALHAVDRQGIVDALYGGRARVAHFWLPPSDPIYPAADRAVPKYTYDPARAAALLQEAGWTRGGDGIVRSAAGEPLHLPLMTTPGDVEEAESVVVIDNWKNLGVTSELRPLSAQELRDGELRAKFPAVSYERRALTVESMAWTARQVSTPENRWSGSNRNGYVNPRLDELWGRALATIDRTERGAILIAALKIMADDAVVNPTHLQAEVITVAAGLTGPSEPSALGRALIWNVWEWAWK